MEVSKLVYGKTQKEVKLIFEACSSKREVGEAIQCLASSVFGEKTQPQFFAPLSDNLSLQWPPLLLGDTLSLQRPLLFLGSGLHSSSSVMLSPGSSLPSSSATPFPGSTFLLSDPLLKWQYG